MANEDGGMKRQPHLNLFIHTRGMMRHRDPGSPLPPTDIRYYQDLARRDNPAWVPERLDTVAGV